MRLRLKIIFQAALICLLAAASAFPAPEFADANWDIVLFLTPVGILKNLLAANPALRSFYLDVSAGQSALTVAQALFMALIYALLAVNGFAILRELARGRH